MHIVEFSDRSDPTEQHLQERHARSVIKTLRRESMVAAKYMPSRQVQNESCSAALRCSVRPRKTRWKACEWPLIMPGSIPLPANRWALARSASAEENLVMRPLASANIASPDWNSPPV